MSNSGSAQRVTPLLRATGSSRRHPLHHVLSSLRRSGIHVTPHFIERLRERRYGAPILRSPASFVEALRQARRIWVGGRRRWPAALVDGRPIVYRMAGTRVVLLGILGPGVTGAVIDPATDDDSQQELAGSSKRNAPRKASGRGARASAQGVRARPTRADVQASAQMSHQGTTPGSNAAGGCLNLWVVRKSMAGLRTQTVCWVNQTIAATVRDRMHAEIDALVATPNAPAFKYLREAKPGNAGKVYSFTMDFGHPIGFVESGQNYPRKLVKAAVMEVTVLRNTQGGGFRTAPIWTGTSPMPVL